MQRATAAMPRCWRAVQRLLGDPDPAVADAASWALDRLSKLCQFLERVDCVGQPFGRDHGAGFDQLAACT